MKQCARHSVKQCSLCGGIYHNIAFRSGYVCEDCIDYIKARPDREI